MLQVASTTPFLPRGQGVRGSHLSAVKPTENNVVSTKQCDISDPSLIHCCNSRKIREHMRVTSELSAMLI